MNAGEREETTDKEFSTDEQVNELLDEVAEIIRTEFVDCEIDVCDSFESSIFPVKEECVETHNVNECIKKEPVEAINGCLKQERVESDSKCSNGSVVPGSHSYFSHSRIPTRQIHVEFDLGQKKVLLLRGNAETLEDVFNEFLKNDSVYSEHLKEDNIVFQHFSTVCNQWVDVEDSHTLNDGTYVKALFYPKKIEANASSLRRNEVYESLFNNSALPEIPCVEKYKSDLTNERLEEKSVVPGGEKTDVKELNVELRAAASLKKIVSEKQHHEIDKKVKDVNETSLCSREMVIDCESDMRETRPKTASRSESAQGIMIVSDTHESYFEQGASEMVIDPSCEISDKTALLCKSNEGTDKKEECGESGKFGSEEDRNLIEENTVKSNVEDIVHIRDSGSEKMSKCGNNKANKYRISSKVHTYSQKRPKFIPRMLSSNQRRCPLLPTPLPRRNTWNYRPSWEAEQQKHQEKLQILQKYYRRILQIQQLQWQRQQEVLQQIQHQQLRQQILKAHFQNQKLPLLPTPHLHNGIPVRGTFPWQRHVR